MGTTLNFAPPAIILINNDITSNVQNIISSQLLITETITGAEFDARLAIDPNYPTIVHLNNLRILVLRNLEDPTNRLLMDLVLFYKNGMVTVLCSKFGPPAKTLEIQNLYYRELISNGKCCSACSPCKKPVDKLGACTYPGNPFFKCYCSCFKKQIKEFPFGG